MWKKPPRSKLNCRCSSIHTNYLSSCWARSYFLYFFVILHCGKAKLIGFLTGLNWSSTRWMCEISDSRLRCRATEPAASRSSGFLDISRLIRPLFLLCFAGFVELNHMLTSCYPPPSANSTSGRTAEASSGAEERERESEGATTASRTPPFGCTEKLWNSEREFVPDWFAPGPFFLLHTYTHTSFFEKKKKKKPCLNDSYHFWTQTNFYLNIVGVGWGSKRNSVKPTDSDQPC